jgi:hypothetical protein
VVAGFEITSNSRSKRASSGAELINFTLSVLLSDFVKRWRDVCRSQILTQVFHVLPLQHIAVVRVMQNSLDAIQYDANAGALDRVDLGAKVMQEGFNVAPMDVAADRILENAVQQMFVFMAHGGLAEFVLINTEYLSLRLL